MNKQIYNVNILVLVWFGRWYLKSFSFQLKQKKKKIKNKNEIPHSTKVALYVNDILFILNIM